MMTEYREEPCRTALNRVSGMMFRWSLNPYVRCALGCTFCYVRAFERRAGPPSGDLYGTSIRVTTNIGTALRVRFGFAQHITASGGWQESVQLVLIR